MDESKAEDDIKELIKSDDESARAVGLVLLSIVAKLGEISSENKELKKELDDIKKTVEPLKTMRNFAVLLVALSVFAGAVTTILSAFKILK